MTPIRIRGKKQTGSRHTLSSLLNPQSHGKRPPSPISSSQPPAKAPRHATSTPTPRSVTARYKSPLELLPVELLEDIFFLCLNISLPQASLVIGLKLASHHVKYQLTLRVLSSANSSEYPCALAAVFPTFREQRESQSALLRVKWMTLAFLKKIIPDFIVRTLVRELGERNLQWMGREPITSKGIEPLIRRYVEDNAYRGNVTPVRGLPAYWEFQWPLSDPFPARRSNGPNVRPRLPPSEGDPDMGNVQVGIGLRDGLVTLWTPSPDDTSIEDYKIVPRQHMRWRILCCLEGCRIPDKLLHGPWTAEKCEFLEILIRGNATVDWIESTSGEVAKQGLLQALREHNAQATRLLLARPLTSPDNEFTEYYANEEARAMNQPSISSFREDPVRRGVGIVPEAEHLRIAVLEEGCDKDVVNALLNAPHPAISLNETEIFQWALMEGIHGNERANWLRQRLRYEAFPTSNVHPFLASRFGSGPYQC